MTTILKLFDFMTLANTDTKHHYRPKAEFCFASIGMSGPFAEGFKQFSEFKSTVQ